MANLNEQLTELQTARDNIKTAIEGKGQIVTKDIRTYAEAINKIVSGGSAGTSGIKQFATEEEMQADPTAAYDDLALVYKNFLTPLTKNSVIRAITIPKQVAIEPPTASMSARWQSNDNSQYISLSYSSTSMTISTRNHESSTSDRYTYNAETSVYELTTQNTNKLEIIQFTKDLLFVDNFTSIIGDIFKINSTTPVTNNCSFNTLYLPMNITIPVENLSGSAYVYDEEGISAGRITVNITTYGDGEVYGTARMYMSSYGCDIRYEYSDGKLVRSSLKINNETITDETITDVTLPATFHTIPDYKDIFNNIIKPTEVYFGGLFRYAEHEPGDILIGYRATDISTVSGSTDLDVSTAHTKQYRLNWDKVWNNFLNVMMTHEEFSTRTYTSTHYAVCIFDNKVHMLLLNASYATYVGRPYFKIEDNMTNAGKIVDLCSTHNSTGTFIAYDVSVDMNTYDTEVNIMKTGPIENGPAYNFNFTSISDTYIIGSIYFSATNAIQYTPLNYKGDIWCAYQTAANSWSIRHSYLPTPQVISIQEYIPAYTQLSAINENELFADKTVYSKKGVITGDGSIYDNLDASQVKSKLFNISSSKTQYTKYCISTPAVGTSSSDYQKMYTNKLIYWKDNGLLPGETVYVDMSELDTSTHPYYSSNRFYNSTGDKYINTATSGTVKIYNSDGTTAYTLSTLTVKSTIGVINDYAYIYCLDSTDTRYGLCKINLADGTYTKVCTAQDMSSYSGTHKIYPKLILNRYICVWHNLVITTAVDNTYPRLNYVAIYDTTNNKNLDVVSTIYNSEYKYTKADRCVFTWTNSKIYVNLRTAIPISANSTYGGSWFGYCSIPNMTLTTTHNSPYESSYYYDPNVYATYGNTVCYNDTPYIITEKFTENAVYGEGDFRLQKLTDRVVSAESDRYIARISWTEAFPKKAEYNLVRLGHSVDKYLLVSKENNYKLLVTKCKITLNGNIFTFTPCGPVYNINTNNNYMYWWDKSGASKSITTYFNELNGGFDSTGIGDFAPTRFDFDNSDDNSLLEITYNNGYFGTVKLRNLTNCDSTEAELIYLLNGSNFMVIHSDDMTPFVS